MCSNTQRNMKHLTLAYTLLFGLILSACSSEDKEATARFEGKLVYKITSNLRQFDESDSSGFQVIYAKDSMVKTDNFTQFGKQSFLKHIPKNRAYTLIDFLGDKLAIQTIPDSVKVAADKYSFTPLNETTEIAGLKANKVEVAIKDRTDPIEMWYTPEISHDYSDAIPGLKGLPIKYTLVIGDEELTYTLIKAERKEMHIDNFGLPSDYKVITTDEFDAYITTAQEEIEN